VGPGTTVGGFKIDRLLGKGGMGEVYLARQLSMDRDVALKILPSSMTVDEQLVQRFLQEVRMAARLEHQHIVRAYEAGEDSGVYFLAMSYVKGDTLSDLLADGSVLEEKDALSITRQMATALAHAWDEYQMLHRDIKPSNIMLDKNGEPKLMDMGLCKSLGEQAGMTLSGTVMGTPNYMSPEQASGRGDIDFRADVYSLGATLYHMLTGRMPFDGSSIMEVLRKQATESLPDPRESNPAVSETCVGLMEIMLAKDPAGRHPSWEALIADVDCVLGGKQATAVALPAGQSVLVRIRSAEPAPAAGPVSRKPIVLGQSTIRKLHEHDHVRHHSPKSSSKPGSKGPVIALSIAAAVLLLAVGLGVLVVAQMKKAARRTAIAAWQAEKKRVQPPASKSAKPPVASPRKATDAKLAALRKQFDEAVAYAVAHPDSFMGASTRFEEVCRRARGTELEERVEQEIATLEERRREQVDAVMADLKAKSDALSAEGKRGEAAALVRGYSGALAADTRQRRETLAATLEKKAPTPAPARVVEGSTPSAAETAAPGQQAAKDLNALADALLRLDFKAAQKQLTGAEPGGMDAAQWQATRELALRVAAMPEIIRASVQGDIGKEVSVRLNRGTLKVRVTAVEGKKVLAEEVIRSGGKEAGRVTRNFALADLSVQEQFRRLGKETTPELCIMRGLLAYEGKAEEKAVQYFQQSESELGRLLCGRIVAVQATRQAAVAAAQQEAAEAAAARAFAELLGRAGLSGGNKTRDELVLAAKRKVFMEEQVQTVERALKAFANEFADTDLAAEHAELLGVLKNLTPGIALYYNQEMLNRVVEQLKKDNPAEVNITPTVFKTENSELVLNLSGLTGLKDIAAVRGLPIRKANLQRTALTDLTPLQGMPLKWVLLHATRVADLTPLKGMPLEDLNVVGAIGYVHHIRDLAPLKGLPLRRLNLQYQREVKDLTPLKGMPLEYLNLTSSLVSDLSPLEGMPLKVLILNHCERIHDVGPLAGLPLKELRVFRVPIRDFSPLKGIEGLKVHR